MPIPALDQHGLLPVGVHDCEWPEIQQRFCWNAHRTGLFGKLQDFLTQKWTPLNVRADLWVNGSFTRSKQTPDDIDLVADVSHLNNVDVGPVLMLFMDRESIKRDFKVDFWFKHPLVPTDLTEYFRYAGFKAGAELNLDPKHIKGILRVNP